MSRGLELSEVGAEPGEGTGAESEATLAKLASLRVGCSKNSHSRPAAAAEVLVGEERALDNDT